MFWVVVSTATGLAYVPTGDADVEYVSLLGRRGAEGVIVAGREACLVVARNFFKLRGCFGQPP